MPLFSISGKKAKKISVLKTKLESDIQTLFETNLEEILDIYFVYHEFPTSFGGRMDTLGIDKNGSPVIIEYKRTQNDSVINQGLSYLHWLLDHKGDFEKLVTEKLAKLYNSPILTFDGTVKTNSFIDWSSPRVICVAESYNKFDLDTADILPIRIELLKYQLYDNNTLHVESVTQQKVKVHKPKIVQNNTHSIREEKEYTLEYHLNQASTNVKEIFEIIKEKIITLDDSIVEAAKAKYIAYKLTRNFVDIVVFKNSLKIFLNIHSGELNDPYKLARDLTKPDKVGHWGNGDYEVKLDNKENIVKVFDLIQQSYNYNK